MPSDSPVTVLVQQSNVKSRKKADLIVGTPTVDLQSIHHVVSKSTDMASFADFFRPPESTADHVSSDSRGLAADLQGGLSGLYSRLRASVAGSREMENTTTALPVVHAPRTQDTSVSQPSSGRVSGVQSPRAIAVDPPSAVDSAVRLIQKSTSTTRPPSSSKLRSPQAGSFSLTSLNPAVTEVNVHVTSKSNTRGRSEVEHKQEDEDDVSLDGAASRQSDGIDVRNSSQVTDQELINPLDSPLHLPRKLALPKLDTRGISNHVRESSETSNERVIKPSIVTLNSEVSGKTSMDISQNHPAE